VGAGLVAAAEVAASPEAAGTAAVFPAGEAIVEAVAPAADGENGDNP
jgi:hypothetical protein